MLTLDRMAKPFSWHFSGPGATMQSLPSPFACWHKHTSKLTTFSKYCMPYQGLHCDGANGTSADLEMTVNMLIQIDKLVQLLESPVFTCSTEYTTNRR